MTKLLLAKLSVNVDPPHAGAIFKVIEIEENHGVNEIRLEEVVTAIHHYTQQDMNIAQNALFKLRQEKTDIKRFLWACVMAKGGKIGIPSHIFMDAMDESNEVVRWSDFQNNLEIIEARKHHDK